MWAWVARALGMGKVQVSLADDATAGYWNPAGLVNQKTKYDGVLMHSELFSGIVKNDYAAFSHAARRQERLGRQRASAWASMTLPTPAT